MNQTSGSCLVETQPAETPEFFTTAEVAGRYRTNDSTVRYWRHIGYGPRGVRVGRKVLYPAAEIERFDAELGQAERDARSSV